MPKQNIEDWTDMRIVDLRSDTVTLPTQEMLEAILHAPLGDDVFQEDPTVNRLQDLAARKMGKAGALLVISGTQGNLVSLLSHTKRGDEVILEATSHIFLYEVGGMAAIGGLMARTIPGRMGVIDPCDVERAIREENIHHPETALICIENTHNSAGGTCWTPSQVKAVYDVAKKHGLKVHMDGARIFNAAVALGVDVREFTRYVDSVMFCLSKGLSAPIGSLVVGDEEFVERARRWRKMLGGGMRQAGVIAAPGVIALEKMVDRMKEDHDNAKVLAEGLAKIKGITVNLETVQTNIVRYDLGGLGMSAREFTSKLGEFGVKALGSGMGIRMVTHRMISQDDIHYTLSVVERIAKHR